METTETIKPLVEVYYRVTLVAEVDTERGEVRRVTLNTAIGEHEAVEIQGDVLGVPLAEIMSDREVRAALDSGIKIAESAEWPAWDYEG